MRFHSFGYEAGDVRFHNCVIVVFSPCMASTSAKDLGACSPRKYFEIRCSEISEIASEAILGQEQSRSSYRYMARGELHLNFGCPCMHC